ncbi:MAG: hypothetical protein ACM3PF_02265 [Bacteroidota bacterium]
MKQKFVVTAGIALALCLAAGSASRADARGRYWSADRPITIVETASTHAAGSRVYLVVDDPSYDLSGTHHTLYLVDDGAMVRAKTGQPVAFVSTGAMPTEVVPVTATYRQDWMAVAAGDRPVRCLTPIRAEEVNGPSMMSMGPEHVEHMEAMKAAAHRHHPMRYSATHRRHYNPHHKPLSFANYHRARTTAEYTTASPAVSEYATATYAVDEGVMGHELYQLGNSFYMQEGDTWCRAESWRGPYVQVHKGMVPREVRECAHARDDGDADRDDVPEGAYER